MTVHPYQIGLMNSLRILRTVDFGVYLEGGEEGILLPKRYVPKEAKVDDVLEVFVYRDSENRIIATTEKPLAMLWEMAFLSVSDVNEKGAFLDWGLMKDLFVPFKEQKVRMQKGQSYVVYVYLDYETNRLAATTRLNRFINVLPIDYEEGEQVELFVVNNTPLGFSCVINNRHWGMLYDNEVFVALSPGMKIPGYIKQIRPDEKIDLQLQAPGLILSDILADQVLYFLNQHDGVLSITDKSDPKTIYQTFGASKKNFKKALGHLYKKGLVDLKSDGVYLKK